MADPADDAAGNGTADPVEAVGAALAAIGSVGAELNAFVEARPKAEQEAAGAEGPLAGVPIAVKDMFVDEDRRPTCGSRVGARDLSGTAEVIARLRTAGAVVVGYTNLHEWGLGTTSAVTATGPIRNPRDRDLVAGGSSGGSAAAVASGIVRAATGTDAGGSIRVPAACCEIVGFKPTWGRVPLHGFAEGEEGPPVDHTGPLARSVDDVQTMFEVMANVSIDPVDVSGLRLGILRPHFFDGAAPEIAGVVLAAASSLGARVASVTDLELEGAPMAGHALSLLLLAHTAQVVAEDLGSQPEAFQPETLNLLQLGLAASEDDLDRAEAMRVALRSAWDRVFEEVDVVVTPTIPAPPPRIDHLAVELPSGVTSAEPAYISFNAPMNLGGVPALSLPCGEGRSGRAVNITITAARGRDDVVLALGRAVEETTERRYVDRIAIPTEGDTP